jgi:hypothetical protein
MNTIMTCIGGKCDGQKVSVEYGRLYVRLTPPQPMQSLAELKGSVTPTIKLYDDEIYRVEMIVGEHETFKLLVAEKSGMDSVIRKLLDCYKPKSLNPQSDHERITR